MSHYDREADVAFLDLGPFDGGRVVGDHRPWGLVIRERESERIVGFEFWRASRRFPDDLLAELPEPRPGSNVRGARGSSSSARPR